MCRCGCTCKKTQAHLPSTLDAFRVYFFFFYQYVLCATFIFLDFSFVLYTFTTKECCILNEAVCKRLFFSIFLNSFSSIFVLFADSDFYHTQKYVYSTCADVKRNKTVVFWRFFCCCSFDDCAIASANSHFQQTSSNRIELRRVQGIVQ